MARKIVPPAYLAAVPSPADAQPVKQAEPRKTAPPPAPKASTASKTSNKSDFVRQHPNLSAAEIVEAAKKQGIKLSTQLVYVVRSASGGAKKAKSGAKKTASKAPSARRKTAPKNGGVSASDFIRQHPELSPNDLVALGEKQGIKFSRNLVYLVRGPRGANTPAKAAPSRATISAASAPKTVASRAASSAPLSSTSTDEHELARLILAVGFERAEMMLSALRNALR